VPDNLVVEIQENTRLAIRDLIDITDDLDIDDMLAIGEEVNILINASTRNRSIASIGNFGATQDSVPVFKNYNQIQ